MPVVAALAPAAIGLYQAISGGIKASKAQKALEAKANGFQPNQSILDYYNKALSRYNPNPYQTAGYQQQENQINRNLATGVNGLQSRRLGVGGIGGLVQQANDASARAAGNAEQQSNNELGRLGSAAGAKANEQQRGFDMNYNLLAAKAGAGASMENSGISNLYSGLSNYAYLNSMNKKNTGSGVWGSF